MTAPDPLTRLWPASAFSEDLRAQWPQLRERLLAWHASHGRHDLPWSSSDPYVVWLSETMLQQTQVSTVRRYFGPWLARFPTLAALAAAPEDAVMKQWEGLGYYSRARRLRQAAQQMVAQHGGQVPEARADRLALPGVGPSTASAIGAFAFGAREAIFDGNVRRVWGRWAAARLPEPMTDRARDRWLWSFAQAVMPEAPNQAGPWTQAIMDLGATICTPKRSQCDRCPLAEHCDARRIGTPELFPPVAPRAAVQIWNLRWAWVVDEQGRLAVVQRPAEGVWGRLWALPELSPEARPPAPLASGRHALTHRRVQWSIHPVSMANLPGSVTWMDRAEWEQQAWPQPLRRWWAALSPKDRDHLWPSPASTA